MSKIRIYELAKELRLDNKKVIDEAKGEDGFNISSHRVIDNKNSIS